MRALITGILSKIDSLFQSVLMYKNIAVAALIGALLWIVRSKNEAIADLKMGAEQAAHETNIALRTKELQDAKQTADKALEAYNAWLSAHGKEQIKN